MAAGPTAGCGAGRGSGVPAIRAQSHRLITGLLALLLAGTALWYALAQGGQMSLAALLGTQAVGIVALAVALLRRWRALVAVALFPLLAPEALVLVERGPLLVAPLLGAALLLAAELAFWSIDAAGCGPSSRGLRVALAARAMAAAAAGTVLGILVLAIAGLRAAGSLDLTIIGAVAVVAVLGLTVYLIRSGLREHAGG